MMNHFTPNVSQILAFSREEAIRLESSTVRPEHLLLAMLRVKEGPVNGVFRRMNINTAAIKEQLESDVRHELAMPSAEDAVNLNEGASNVLKLAILEARIQRKESVEEIHLLLALLHDRADNKAKMLLEEQNLNYERLTDYLSDIRNRQPADMGDGNPVKDALGMPDSDYEEADDSRDRTGEPGRQTARQTGEKKGTPVVDNFGIDLTKAAAEGKLDPVVGREKEIMRVVEILGRRKKNNPILIGEPGVGKSAIVEGLAQLIADRRTSPLLYGKRVVSLDLTGIVAGTKYRGQFEERLKALIRELETHPEIIVFIDEIHTLVGAGSATGTMDAANILKPALARGTIQCIGATTLDEYRKSIEKDGALERRFQKVTVEAATKEETLHILHNIKDRYEHHHNVRYTEEALDACVRLTERYICDRQFPDKAIDALDETGSHVHTVNASVPGEIIEKEKELSAVKEQKQQAVRDQNYELAASYRDRQTAIEQEISVMNERWLHCEGSRPVQVDDTDVARVVSVMTGIPVQRMEESETERLRTMADRLKQEVIAQDKAIEKMVRAIQRNRVGLREPNRPIGAFMFLGPTGVGKTYLAKKLAEYMFGSSDALIRVDMSEFTESFNVSRLVGAPPGYVGYEEGGQLTERVRRHPYSIVLLDELEKAHGNVFNLLLQVLDEGRLTDGNGRFVDFRNTVIIMTSNAGTRQLKEFSHGVGFTAGSFGHDMDEKDKEYARSIIQKSLSKQFSPEFLNRLDEIITFDQLDLEAIKRMVDLELRGLYSRMTDLGYSLTVTDEAKAYVAGKGYDIQFGARPLKRSIQNNIEDLICERLINGELNPDRPVTIDYNKEKGMFIS